MLKIVTTALIVTFVGFGAYAVTIIDAKRSSNLRNETGIRVQKGSGSDTGKWSTATPTSIYDPASAMTTAIVAAAAAAWRSALYPSNWLPVGAGGAPTSDGKFLHDFSYAGYLAGDVAIPTNVGANVTRVLSASTWGNGASDATSGIQNAINEVCAGGGGTVSFSAGLFRVRPQGSATYALHLKCRDLILRGTKSTAGAPATQLFNDEPNMRQKRVIVMGDAGTGVSASLYDTSGNTANNKTFLRSDVLLPTRVIPVTSVAGYSVNDYVVVTADWSDAFRAEHNMSSHWPVSSARGLLFYRRVTAVNSSNNTLTVDIPIRYLLKTRDNARVYRPREFFANIGIENISIGMRENTLSGQGSTQYDQVGTGAYQMHNASAIQVVLVRHGWIRNLTTFRPSVNGEDRHLLSNGVHLTASTRSITVENVRMEKPQFRGEGGNGYLFQINGAENLLRNNVASRGRHNFLLSGAVASGNVLLSNSSSSGNDNDDFHQYLSPANLIDNHRLADTGFATFNRQSSSSGAGYTSSQSVLWNTYLNSSSSIRSDQVGWGYVIGTQGRSDGVDAPTDFVEGLGIGDGLSPSSLYLDQKAKRDASSAY